MNKKEQIEEMKTLLLETYVEWLDKPATDKKPNLYDMDANKLYNAGYRKVPEGTLVMTKEELLKTMESRYVYDTTRGNKVNIIEMAREIERKETAKEILQMLIGRAFEDRVDSKDVQFIAEEYGVEVEE